MEEIPFGNGVFVIVYSGGKNELPNGSVSSRRRQQNTALPFPKGISQPSILLFQEENLLHRFPENLRHLQSQDRGRHIPP